MNIDIYIYKPLACPKQKLLYSTIHEQLPIQRWRYGAGVLHMKMQIALFPAYLKLNFIRNRKEINFDSTSKINSDKKLSSLNEWCEIPSLCDHILFIS